MDEFRKLGLSEDILQTLEKKGFQKPSQIQEETIPILLEGKFDVIGQSQTGTGKTASFGLPIIEKCTVNQGFVQAIILAPTRELALQVTTEMNSLKGDRDLRITTVYGGSPISKQIKTLKEGVDIVVGTPGRVIDLIKRKVLDISNVSYAVLDEADEMLNMGFVEDIETVLSNTNNNKNTLLFSATMPKPILKIAERFMREYIIVRVKKEQVTIDLTEQHYYDVMSKDRFEALKRIIDYSDEFYGIVFCKTKVSVDKLTQQLMDAHYNAGSIHGDISQAQREKILNQFRKRRINILVATDVAARGIDVDELTHVVNYSLPQSPETYVHRIGRTGRAGRKGTAITFVMPSERRGLRFIEKIVKTKLEKKEFPRIDEILAKRQDKIKDRISRIVEKNDNHKFEKLTEELLENTDSKKLISSLLASLFKRDMSENRYRELSEVTKEEPRNDRYRKGGRRNNDRNRNSRGGRRDSGNRRNSNNKKNNSGRNNSRSGNNKSNKRNDRRR